MPESVTDRTSRCHEMICLLTKKKSYYYDAEAIKEPVFSCHHAANAARRGATTTKMSMVHRVKLHTP
jgi:hypothetical protein